MNPVTVSSMSAIQQTFAKDPETALYANEIYNTLGETMLAKSGIYGAFAREMALRQRSEGLVLAFGALLGPREGDFKWEGMKTRVVMVFGGRDEIAPVSEGRYAVEKLQGLEGVEARLVLLEEAGHWIIWECEEFVRDEIMKMVGG